MAYHSSCFGLPAPDQERLEGAQGCLGKEEHGLFCVAAVAGYERQEVAMSNTTDGRASF